MNYISINYTLEFKLNFAPEYQWTKDGKCFNTKTNRQIKQSYNSGCIGYYIRSKFYSLKYLRTKLQKIKQVKKIGEPSWLYD